MEIRKVAILFIVAAISQFHPFLVSGEANAYEECGGSYCRSGGCDHAIKVSCSTIHSDTVICSGVLVEKVWIFTAEHCFDNVTSVYDSCSFTTGQGQGEGIMPVSIVDDGFIVPGRHDGIRIFRLSPETLFSRPMARILLPRSDDNGVDLSFNHLKRKALQFCAWGRVSETGYAQEVKCMPFTLLTEQHCAKSFDQEGDGTFCAGVDTGYGLTCRGDSGGGLIWVDDSTRESYLIGILSKGRTDYPCSSESCGNFEIGNEFMNVSTLMREWGQHFHVIVPPEISTTVGSSGESWNFISFVLGILMILSGAFL